LRVNFIDLPQLLKNKRASRRQKDLADVEALTAKGARKLDRRRTTRKKVE